jgi:hypothetical protein
MQRSSRPLAASVATSPRHAPRPPPRPPVLPPARPARSSRPLVQRARPTRSPTHPVLRPAAHDHVSRLEPCAPPPVRFASAGPLICGSKRTAGQQADRSRRDAAPRSIQGGHLPRAATPRGSPRTACVRRIRSRVRLLSMGPLMCGSKRTAGQQGDRSRQDALRHPSAVAHMRVARRAPSHGRFLSTAGGHPPAGPFAVHGTPNVRQQTDRAARSGPVGGEEGSREGTGRGRGGV